MAGMQEGRWSMVVEPHLDVFSLDYISDVKSIC
jgi:hypothetical protein